MHIESIALKGFRNITDLRLAPGPGVNLLIGANAQGKTNVIEAIDLLSTGSSFRTPEFRDMIGWEATRAEVAATVSAVAGRDHIKVTMDSARKGFQRNGKRALVKGTASLKTVIFAPEEIMLLRSSPGARRRYVDAFISQLLPAHRGNVSKYEKVVRQRNRILSDADTPKVSRMKELAPWDDQLVELGGRIVIARHEWIERLNEHLPGQYMKIASIDGRAEFVYVPHCGAGLVGQGLPAIRGGLERQLAARREDEFMRCTTLVGPHRDDLEARIGGAAVKSFGSQGQHRSFVLALKLAEMAMLKEEAREDPVLLLDDVASELDCDRNRFFFEAIAANTGQVFITATSEKEIGPMGSGRTQLFSVSRGTAVARK